MLMLNRLRKRGSIISNARNFANTSKIAGGSMNTTTLTVPVKDVDEITTHLFIHASEKEVNSIMRAVRSSLGNTHNTLDIFKKHMKVNRSANVAWFTKWVWEVVNKGTDTAANITSYDANEKSVLEAKLAEECSTARSKSHSEAQLKRQGKSITGVEPLDPKAVIDKLFLNIPATTTAKILSHIEEWKRESCNTLNTKLQKTLFNKRMRETCAWNVELIIPIHEQLGFKVDVHLQRHVDKVS